MVVRGVGLITEGSGFDSQSHRSPVLSAKAPEMNLGGPPRLEGLDDGKTPQEGQSQGQGSPRSRNLPIYLRPA